MDLELTPLVVAIPNHGMIEALLAREPRQEAELVGERIVHRDLRYPVP